MGRKYAKINLDATIIPQHIVSTAIGKDGLPRIGPTAVPDESFRAIEPLTVS